jgi:hypothetical protein
MRRERDEHESVASLQAEFCILTLMYGPPRVPSGIIELPAVGMEEHRGGDVEQREDTGGCARLMAADHC